MAPQCSIPDCSQPRPRPTPAERFWAKVEKTDSCWLWTGQLSNAGYGMLLVSRRMRNAHRWAYEYFVGPVPEGLEIDHLCRIRRCVRPDHMEAVTRSVNQLRGNSWWRRKTHCPRGHPYDSANTLSYGKKPKRQCRMCTNDRKRRAYDPQARKLYMQSWRARRDAAAGGHGPAPRSRQVLTLT